VAHSRFVIRRTATPTVTMNSPSAAPHATLISVPLGDHRDGVARDDQQRERPVEEPGAPARDRADHRAHERQHDHRAADDDPER
jgi:hypothetical protein